VSQRRSSFVVASITLHAIVFGALLVTSLLATDGLPEPRIGLKLTLDRVVQPVNIALPPPARTPARASSRGPSTVSESRPEIPAPVDPPTGVAPATADQTIAASTVNRMIAVERGSGLIERPGRVESAPTAPPIARSPVRPHSGVQTPRKIVDVAPKYPALARESHTEGLVILDVIIDENGNVTSTRVLKSVTLLDQAAIEAVRQWKFTPTRLNGEPIPIVMTVTVSFRLQ
jgi:protein TonB